MKDLAFDIRIAAAPVHVNRRHLGRRLA